MRVGRGIAVVTLLAVEFVATGYAAFLVWAVSISRLGAARDLWLLAGKRFFACAALSMLFAMIVYGVNRIVGQRFARVTAFVAFAIVIIASVSGLVSFLSRP